MNDNEKVKAMIGDAKEQTNKSIWKFLDELSANRLIYSTHLKGFETELFDNDIFIYAGVVHKNIANMLVVCIDQCNTKDEIADEDTTYYGSGRYASQEEMRPSPVWQLSYSMSIMKSRLESHNFGALTYGILLTKSNILNKKEVKKDWNNESVNVIDGIQCYSDKSIVINENGHLDAKAFVDAILIKDDAQYCNKKDQELYEEDNGYSDTLDKLLREGMVKDEEDNVMIIRKT